MFSKKNHEPINIEKMKGIEPAEMTPLLAQAMLDHAIHLSSPKPPTCTSKNTLEIINSEINYFNILALYLIARACIAQSDNEKNVASYKKILKNSFWKKDYGLIDSEKDAKNEFGFEVNNEDKVIFNISSTSSMAAHASDVKKKENKNGFTVCADSPDRFSFLQNLENDKTRVWQCNPKFHTQKMSIINLVHDAKYLNLLRSYSTLSHEAGIRLPLNPNPDTMLSPYSYAAALDAAIICMEITKTSYEKNKVGFAHVRPPGHHAGVNFGEGFCLINNIACAALYLWVIKRQENLKEFDQTFLSSKLKKELNTTDDFLNFINHDVNKNNVNKILIIDIDEHQGNGTQFILEKNPLFENHFDILDIYNKENFKGDNHFYHEKSPVNISSQVFDYPLSKKNGKSESHLLSDIKKKIEENNYEYVFVSWGLDASKNDPLGYLGYKDSFYTSLIELLNKKMPGKFTCVTEGGYNLNNNERITTACLRLFEKSQQTQASGNINKRKRKNEAQTDKQEEQYDSDQLLQIAKHRKY